MVERKKIDNVWITNDNSKGYKFYARKGNSVKLTFV